MFQLKLYFARVSLRRVNWPRSVYAITNTQLSLSISQTGRYRNRNVHSASRSPKEGITQCKNQALLENKRSKMKTTLPAFNKHTEKRCLFVDIINSIYCFSTLLCHIAPHLLLLPSFYFHTWKIKCKEWFLKVITRQWICQRPLLLSQGLEF